MAKNIFMVSLLCWVLAVLPAKAEAAHNFSYPEQERNSIIINRTDFPVLYLSEPRIKGETVWLLQARLKELGYDIVPDGIYDEETERIVRLFQLAHGMEDNGVVNRQLWLKLTEEERGEDCLTERKEQLKGRVIIVIDTATRRLTVYENGKEVVSYPVAVGKSSTPSPLGEWRIVHKSLNWGNGFGTRWMGLNVPWGIYGIHGTDKPGSIGTYASHGCIRMFNRDVEKLYPMIPWGTTVRIVRNGKMYPEKVLPQPLQKGSSGQQVVYVQARLKDLGYVFDRADGRFGNMTELAVKYFQITHGLEPTGKVDEDVYRALGLID
ncbi:Putative peptidoglycan binding domain-containing protein [Thermosyntropha lipolytica DSM 11003]|uniref:Putative peptidoglycan binding domain-containing protein n=1 Tax=Thermosyntropha lipolytica DSM 11003 TaxID=1123382 RepID=A0A1M5JGA8_9FIRM|nr:peptidoglycan-binding protein [Thermosyntropha lipolytica]SHG39538.1 Putative peptidoglycan binding domain-containing protein [Thermosyntropha lipolytica DSM 11003]